MKVGLKERLEGRGRHRWPPVRALLAAALSTVAVALAFAAPALGDSPAWELTSLHGPTNVPLQPKVNEVVTVSFHANVGKFLLDFENSETSESGETGYLPYDATDGEVQEALEKLRHGEPKKAIGAGNVKVTGDGYDEETETGTYNIEFVGALAGRYLEEPLAVEGEVTTHEEDQFEREEEMRGKREPEEPEGEAEIATGGYHGTVTYRLMLANRGAVASSGPLRLRDQLPAGLSTRALPQGSGWACEPPRAGKSEAEVEKEQKQEEKRDKAGKLPAGAGLSSFECSYTGVVNPDGAPPPVAAEAYVETSTLQQGATLENTASIEGGGGAESSVKERATVDSAPAEFGLQLFTAGTSGPSGETYTQAGGHPYAATTGLFFNTALHVEAASKETTVAVSGRVKDADVKLPAGFVGNPLATERCSQADFTRGVPGGPEPEEACPANSQVGTAQVYFGEFTSAPETVAVYNLKPPPGVPAEFGFLIIHAVPVRLDARVVHEAAGGGEYRVAVLSADVNEALNVYGVQLSLWGAPFEASHTAERFKNFTQTEAPYTGPEKPFLTNPTDCLAEADALQPASSDLNLAPVTTAVVDSWERPGALDAQGAPAYPGLHWSEDQTFSPPVTGCEALSFKPEASFLPRTGEEEEGAPAGTTQAEAPSGYKFELTIPQHEAMGQLATPELRGTSVTLPEGLVLSPAAANGLVACTAGDIDLESTERGNCPLASQVGTVSIESPLLEEPLPGRVYVGEPECHPCDGQQVAEGELLKLYIEAEEANAPAATGVRVKLSGSASVNQQNGQITTTFNNNPQLPFERLILKLKGGPRAALANPATCGELNASSLLTPWSLGGMTSAGESVAGTAAPTALPSPGFTITGCGASRPFDPSFNAGTHSSKAGAYSSLDVTFSRHDGEQDLSGVTVQTPPGLLGKIAGIPRCEGVAAESTEVECPAASQLGVASSAAGAGSEPYVVEGPVYLTGGYGGAPFGLKIAVPAKAGPFELGKVVVRAAININKTTSAITVTSQPLPQSIDGIPFRLKAVKVEIDRPEFMFNPTNCETQAITASLTGQPATSAESPVTVGEHANFTASDCGALSFKPTFTATTEGKTSKLDGASLDVKVEQHPGEANIRKVELELPEALPSRQTTLNKACPEKQFAENPAGCDEGSLVGTATAHTPLLSAPLTGPAYLVSHGGLAFPDLVFLLQGEGVHIELIGNTFIKKIDGKEITFSKFEAVPDAPISSFETDLSEGPHSVLDFYGNFCAKKELLAPTTIVAQNSARFEQTTKIQVTGCPPTVSIAKTQVKGSKVVVTLKLSQSGSVSLTGKAIKATQRTLQAGTRTVTVSLSKTGKTAARHHKKISVVATLTAAKQQSTDSASFKA